jgi:hypothetical protein
MAYANINFQPRLLRLIVTDTTTDLSEITPQTTPIVGTVDIDDGGYTLNAGTNTITVTQDGRYQLRGYLAFINAAGGATRFTMNFYWEVNTVQVSPDYQDNYIRDSSGAEEQGQGFTTLTLELNAGDVIRMQHVQVSGVGTGTILLSGPPNYVEIERVR